MRIGIGLDVHPLVAGRKLVLGGVEVPCDRGLAGHSDGDVLLHAIGDALLGAAGLGDLGTHFPSGDPATAGIASGELIRKIRAMLADRDLTVHWLDAVVALEAPKLRPHLDAMRTAVADLLQVPPDRVSLKATTTDGLGLVGRGEGAAAQAVVLLTGPAA